jgi:PilZ domain
VDSEEQLRAGGQARFDASAMSEFMNSRTEHRHYPRFAVRLPFRLRLITTSGEPKVKTLLTKNVSKAGLCFFSPLNVEPGVSIEVEVTLAGYGPKGGDLHISSVGHIVRAEAGSEPGWFQLAAAFEEPSSLSGWNQLAEAFEDFT